MNLNKIINFEVDINRKKSFQEKAIKSLAAFLTLMLLFTLLSRSASALTVPQVTTAPPEAGTIDHSLQINGKIHANKEVLVYMEPNIRVASVDVAEGAPVKAGDILFHLDLEDLEEQLSKAKDELKKAELRQSDAKSAKDQSSKNKQTAINRATEDYNNILSSADVRVQKASEDMNEAQNKWENYKKNGSDANMQASLEADYKTKKGVYEEAVANKQSSLLNAQRAIDDAKNAVTSDHSAEIAAMDIERMKKDIEKLEVPKAAHGEVRTAKSGTVNKINVTPGSRTGDGPAVSMADSTSGYYFKGEAPLETVKSFKEGDKVSLVFSMGNTKLEDLTITSLYASPADSSAYEVIVNLPQNLENPGATASMEIKKQSDNYNTCVPLEALHREDGKTFVLVISEKQTVMGRETTVERIDVEIEDKDTLNAAIRGSLTQDQKLVITSNKPLKPGDRVRLADQ